MSVEGLDAGSSVKRVLIRVGIGVLILVTVLFASWSAFTTSGRRVVFCPIRDAKLKEMTQGSDNAALLKISPKEVRLTRDASAE